MLPFRAACPLFIDILTIRKIFPQPPFRPLFPPAGEGRESRGASPSGAVCARPPAAQAEQTASSHAHADILLPNVAKPC